jgi:hypothetical protein
MITLSNPSIGARTTRAPRLRPATASTWAVLAAQLARADSLIRQYPGRRKVATKIASAAEIYRARAARAALPPARDPICEAACYEQTEGREPCDSRLCRATVR